MRTQAEAMDPERVQEWSDEAALECDEKEDKTRQEFASECDVNVILRRFGAGGFEVRPVQYGVQDTDLELQELYASAAELDSAWTRLPARLKGRYRNWSELVGAIQRGEASLVDKDGVESVPKEVVPPVVVSA